jgi:hypothetical protein
MLDDLLKSKIELLQEQIDNLEKSGFFTEKEMDKLSFPLKMEQTALQIQLTATEYGLTFRQAIFFVPSKYRIFDINVIDAQVLTPNYQPA